MLCIFIEVENHGVENHGRSNKIKWVRFNQFQRMQEDKDGDAGCITKLTNIHQGNEEVDNLVTLKTLDHLNAVEVKDSEDYQFELPESFAGDENESPRLILT